MKTFIKEFKEFALKGNVFDLAVGIIIGGAIGAIVKSLVENVITPHHRSGLRRTGGFLRPYAGTGQDRLVHQ